MGGVSNRSVPLPSSWRGPAARNWYGRPCSSGSDAWASDRRWTSRGVSRVPATVRATVHGPSGDGGTPQPQNMCRKKTETDLRTKYTKELS